MAKNSGKTVGTSRIKFMFEAEVADDQIQWDGLEAKPQTARLLSEAADYGLRSSPPYALRHRCWPHRRRGARECSDRLQDQHTWRGLQTVRVGSTPCRELSRRQPDPGFSLSIGRTRELQRI